MGRAGPQGNGSWDPTPLVLLITGKRREGGRNEGVLDARWVRFDFLGRAALHAWVPDRFDDDKAGGKRKKRRRTTGRARGSAIIGGRVRRGKVRKKNLVREMWTQPHSIQQCARAAERGTSHGLLFSLHSAHQVPPWGSEDLSARMRTRSRRGKKGCDQDQGRSLHSSNCYHGHSIGSFEVRPDSFPSNPTQTRVFHSHTPFTCPSHPTGATSAQ